ncbi:hypothetical protein JYT20_01070, partial [Rhodothermus sp. AH-315-K08]|nr:hypothetical protein [Rhodothermus sp. AH-315-K08]
RQCRHYGQKGVGPVYVVYSVYGGAGLSNDTRDRSHGNARSSQRGRRMKPHQRLRLERLSQASTAEGERITAIYLSIVSFVDPTGDSLETRAETTIIPVPSVTHRDRGPSK